MDEENNRLRVTFPASASFSRIATTALSGLASRLEAPSNYIETLKKASLEAVQALQGEGTIALEAKWTEAKSLRINFYNPQVAIDSQENSRLTTKLNNLVSKASVTSSIVQLHLDKPTMEHSASDVA